MFLIDIDGVLKLGNVSIENGARALRILQQREIPYVLVSNGTGNEALKAASLTKIIGVDVLPCELVLSTTALREYLQLHPDMRILSIGCDAHECDYFNHISVCRVTPREVIARHPEIAPELEYIGDSRHEIVEDLSALQFEEIDAIVFFSDSVDYYEDIQVALDIYMNNGSLNPNVCLERQKPTVIVANPDVSYADRTLRPKMTVGGEFLCFSSLVQHFTGAAPENCVFLGKPHRPIFDCALRRLETCKNYNFNSVIYMIGDSLTSDILGANQNGVESVLVLSGMCKNVAEWESLTPNHKPKHVFEDLLEAVELLCDK